MQLKCKRIEKFPYKLYRNDKGVEKKDSKSESNFNIEPLLSNILQNV